MEINSGIFGYSTQAPASYMQEAGGMAARFLHNDYLIGIGLALQKKGHKEYLASCGNVVQRWIGNRLEQVSLQYTNKSFYFALVKGEGLRVFGYIAHAERMTHFHDFAHVGKCVATVKTQQINEVHRTIGQTSAAGAIDLLLSNYPGTLTMLHPARTHRWIGKDRIDWYARRGGRHYRIETSSAGAALRHWDDNQLLLQVTPNQIHYHEYLLREEAC